jgi:hypothetical protein
MIVLFHRCGLLNMKNLVSVLATSTTAKHGSRCVSYKNQQVPDFTGRGKNEYVRGKS